MIARHRSTKYTPTPGGPGSDTDALQTDVMRFMSILGLCLMALFALVQSIPLHDARRTPPEPEAEKLHQDIVLQQLRAQQLKENLDHLAAELQTTTESNTHARRALVSAQQELAQLTGQTEQARSERDHLTTELDVLRHQLVQGREELAVIQRATEEKAQSLRELRQRLGAAQTRLDDIAQRTRDLQHAKDTKARVSPVTERPAAPAPKAEKQGFTLRFASVEALERLVEAGTVSLYAMAGKQAWRLSLDEGHPRFARVAFPTWFHEMAQETVPGSYVRILETTVGDPARFPLVWGVQLPEATRQEIVSLTHEHRGGNLVISPNGQVTLKPE